MSACLIRKHLSYSLESSLFQVKFLFICVSLKDAKIHVKIEIPSLLSHFAADVWEVHLTCQYVFHNIPKSFSFRINWKLCQCQNLKNIFHFRCWFSSNFVLFISVLVGWTSKFLYLVFQISQLMYEHSEYFLPVCIHMCVDKNACACVNVCMCMWRPKVVFGSLYQLLSVVFAESRHLFLQSSPSCSVSLASPGDLSLFPECWDFCLASTPSVCVKAGPHVMDQVLYPQIHHLRNLAALWRSKLSQNFLIFHELSFVVCFLLSIKCEHFLCRYIYNVS